MLLFVGRLQALKGVDLALETLIELRARGRNAMLALSGDLGDRTVDRRSPSSTAGRGGGRDRTRPVSSHPSRTNCFRRGCVRQTSCSCPALREFRARGVGVLGLRHAVVAK